LKNNPLKTYNLSNPLKSTTAQQNKRNEKMTGEIRFRIKLIEKAFKK
jgi:hypothetical protein